MVPSLVPLRPRTGVGLPTFLPYCSDILARGSSIARSRGECLWQPVGRRLIPPLDQSRRWKVPGGGRGSDTNTLFLKEKFKIGVETSEGVGLDHSKSVLGSTLERCVRILYMNEIEHTSTRPPPHHPRGAFPHTHASLSPGVGGRIARQQSFALVP